MKILIACEESQIVCKAFRNKGHLSYSCDILPTSGNNPQWHIKDNVLNVLNDNWDMLIGFPPCTNLASSGARWFSKKIENGSQQESIDFFMQLINAPINKICIENPVGIMSRYYRKPDQIIQPFFFGDQAQKTTCLWLKNLPKLIHNKLPNLFDQNISHVSPGRFIKFVNKKTGKEKKQPYWYAMADKLERSKIRSTTFPGIALAMAEQWG